MCRRVERAFSGFTPQMRDLKNPRKDFLIKII